MYSLPLLALIFAILNWLAVARKWKPVEYVAKPAVTIVLFAWLWQTGKMHGPLAWFAIGAAMSVAGDVFLMVPRDIFMAGLAAFLVAHLTYIIGFNPNLPPVNAFTLIAAVILALIVWRVYVRLTKGLAEHGATALKLPVLAYAIVISLVVLSALVTLIRPEWSRPHAALVAAGAVLFLISDLTLAWDRFVAPVARADLKVIITYHLAQIGILLGAGLHFAR
jgi:uncharacterized membrane protein YhhN